MAACLSIILIIGGFANIFAKDTMWAFHEGLNNIRGIRSERTASWETWRNIWGIVLIVIGVTGLVLAVVGA